MAKRITVFLIPIMILCLMSLPPLLTLSKGTEITLETMPVDPYSLFRGEYVALNYKISELDEEDLDIDIVNNFFINNKTSYKIYAVLVEGKEGIYELSHLSVDKPDKGIYLKAKINQFKTYEDDSYGKEQDVRTATTKYEYNIVYNIDKFFVPRKEAIKYEEAAREGRLLARVKVYNGNAVLTDVEIEEKAS